jgi:O-antigen/teichoic acid export membrane protein
MRLRKVVTNTVISLAGQALTWTSTILLTIAYGRFLGATKLGELYFATTFAALIGFPLEVGFNQQLSRDVAQAPEKALRYLSNTVLLKAVLWLVLYGVLVVLSWRLGYSAPVRVLVAICGMTLLSSGIATGLSAAYYAFGERMSAPVVGNILEKGLAALIGIPLLRHGAGVHAMALVLLAASLVNAAWQAVSFLHLVGIGFPIDLQVIRDLLRTSIPFLAYGGLTIIYFRIDAVLLSLMASSTVVGWYGAGTRLWDTLSFLPNIVIVTIMYPIFARLSVNSMARLKAAIEKSTNFLLFCSIPMAVGMMFTAPSIVGLLYQRAEFVHTVPVLQALAPGLVFLYINFVLSSALVSITQENKTLVMATAALIFNVVLNLIVIPRYQHVGAAAVTSLTELLLLGLEIVLLPRYLLPVRSLIVAAKACLASAVMGVVILALGSLSILVIVPAAVLAYASAALLLGVIPKDDLCALVDAVLSRTRMTTGPTNTADATVEIHLSHETTATQVQAPDATPDDWSQSEVATQ